MIGLMEPLRCGDFRVSDGCVFRVFDPPFQASFWVFWVVVLDRCLSERPLSVLLRCPSSRPSSGSALNRRHEILFRDLEVREVDLWTSFPYQVFDLDAPPPGNCRRPPV